jgi:hypothetical protein
VEIVVNHWLPERHDVGDFDGDRSVQSMAQLEQRLAVRFKDDENGFGLTPDSSNFPQLMIYVRGNLAVIYYVPKDGQTGDVSVGGKMNLNPKEWTTFSITKRDPSETIDVLNESIVPITDALEAAKEFFHSDAQERPRSIEWREL